MLWKEGLGHSYVQLGKLFTAQGLLQRKVTETKVELLLCSPSCVPQCRAKSSQKNWRLCMKVPYGLIVTLRRRTSNCANAFVLFYLAVLEVLPFLGQNYILRVCTMVCLLRRWVLTRRNPENRHEDWLWNTLAIVKLSLACVSPYRS